MDGARDVDPESVARAIVLRQLTMAPRSRAQLAEKLTARGTPESVAQRVLDRMTEVGLVDDEAFAEGWVRSRHTTRGLSRYALARELHAKGIADEIAVEALAQISADDDLAAARGLVTRRLPASRGLDRERRIRRLVGMLVRKGFGGGVAMSVVLEALDQQDGYDGEHR